MNAKPLVIPTDFSVINCYDSHAHFAATGDFASRPDLKDLSVFFSDKSPTPKEAIKNHFKNFSRTEKLSFHFKNLPHAWKSIGTESLFKAVSEVFPEQIIQLTFQDGHSSVLNQFALNHLKKKGFILPEVAYLLSEEKHFEALNFWPKPSPVERENYLLKAQSLFLQGGFTHVRDMTTDFEDIDSLVKLSSEKKFKLGLECFFLVNVLSEVSPVIEKIKKIQIEKKQPNLRYLGVKIFFDGTLGAQTALVSENYADSEKNGHRLWTALEFEAALEMIWKSGLEVAVHAIGDLAVEEVILSARKVSASGTTGFLNIEHAEILKPETIQKMKSLHVRIHCQPSHWLLDRNFIPKKLSRLSQYVFPTERIRLAQIPLFFGCDSPIFAPSLPSTFEGLNQLIADGQAAFQGNVLQCHSHPDRNFAPAISRFQQTESAWNIVTEFKS